MTDEEVGKLWIEWHDADEGMEKWIITKLILKLVEERAQVLATTTCDYDGGCKHSDYLKGHLKEALQDFHIDPETWPKEWR